MRKLVTSGLLALSLCIFSGSVLAGNADDCEPLKQSGLKSLYGLCVAWHNADEDAQGALAQKFYDRAGFEVPGSEVTKVDEPLPEQDFYCPCWENVSIPDVCALGAPVSMSLAADSGRAMFLDRINFQLEGFGSDMGETACAHTIQGLTGNYILNQVENNLSEEEAIDCQSEVEAIATMFVGGSCP